MAKKIKDMVCAVCGGPCKCRQWFNRDNGYGLCYDCSQWLGLRESKSEIESNYGKLGYHFNIRDKKGNVLK